MSKGQLAHLRTSALSQCVGDVRICQVYKDFVNHQTWLQAAGALHHPTATATATATTTATAIAAAATTATAAAAADASAAGATIAADSPDSTARPDVCVTLVGGQMGGLSNSLGIVNGVLNFALRPVAVECRTALL